jgi:hypothetical protein
MIRSQSQRLATARTVSLLLGACAAVFAATAAGEAVIIAGQAQTAKAERVQLATADARTAFAHCGAYDVLVIGHDAFSADDARKAAFSYFDDHCDVGTGRPKA